MCPTGTHLRGSADAHSPCVRSRLSRLGCTEPIGLDCRECMVPGRVTRCQPTQAEHLHWMVAWESPIRRPIDRQSALIIVVNDLHHPATPAAPVLAKPTARVVDVATYMADYTSTRMTCSSTLTMGARFWCLCDSYELVQQCALSRQVP